MRIASGWRLGVVYLCAALWGTDAHAQTRDVPARRDPTAAELAALRTLESEVDGFLDRGRAFRGSVNGLLAREHARQVEGIRGVFDRQLRAERAAEAEARRHAIGVFERFLEAYPEDPERTPDVMFRLAELYFDEAAYAKLDADERADAVAAERRAHALPTDDLTTAPVDYRCSILLYRNVIQRFPAYRMGDAAHYLLGWVLREMGHEDEAQRAYQGLVCPARFRFDAARGFDLAAPLQPAGAPVACGRLVEVLGARAPQLVSPAQSPPDAAPAPDDRAPSGSSAPVAIPRDYADCEPLPGAEGRASRYAAEAWYYVGDHHFDGARDDRGNALAIAAYEASMRESERRATSAGAAAEAAYGPFWARSLYKVGWAWFRTQNGYAPALRAFSRLLDHVDALGPEAAAASNRGDTLKWIGVIFSESDWGAGFAGDDAGARCQGLVESVARPPPDAARPFDCAGILRIASPEDPASFMASRGAAATRRAPTGRPAFIPQDRPWTPEAYLELANDYFQQTKYYEAITLYRLFLARYPLHPQAPRVAEGVAIAYERQRQFRAAIEQGCTLVDYAEGSAWWAANADHPEAQRAAEQLARDALHDAALRHHQTAATLRRDALALAARARDAPAAQRAGLQVNAVEALRRADAEYVAAAQAYTQFVENYPNDEAAYEFRYNRGDALFWSHGYADAARAYGQVRDSNENDQHLAAAALMAVKSLEAALRAQVQARQLDACLAVRAGLRRDELTDDEGAPLLTEAQAAPCAAAPVANGAVTELAVPEGARLLMEARAAYAARVPRALDRGDALRDVVQVDAQHPENAPPYAARFEYLNARTLLRFGHAADAEARYRRILAERCADPTLAGAAFADLSNLLAAQHREDDQEALARESVQRACAVPPALPEDTLVTGQYRHAVAIFRDAERAAPDASAALYERAARDLDAAVRRSPAHPQAPLALFYAALAYERSGRFDTATQTYARVARDYDAARDAGGLPLAGDDLAQRVNLLEQSNFRAGVNLERTFDYDGAIRYYRAVAADARFAGAPEHDAHAHDALASIALITTNLGRWSEAAGAWRDFLPRAAPGRERAEAAFRAAEVPYRAGDHAAGLRALQAYLRGAPASADEGPYRVQAQYEVALAHRALGDDAHYRQSLREVAAVFRASGQQPGSAASAWAAEALYRDLDDRVAAFAREPFARGDAASLRAQIERARERLRAIDAAAREVVALRGGAFSIGALVRQGEAHEALATEEARIGELLEPSRAQQAQLRRAEAAIARLEAVANALARTDPRRAEALRAQAQQLRDALQAQQDAWREPVARAFDAESEAERQLAIIQYAAAVHATRAQNVPTPFAARALERLRAEENRALLDRALARQSAFAYAPGMFDAAAPGAALSQPTPVATPGVARE